MRQHLAEVRQTALEMKQTIVTMVEKGGELFRSEPLTKEDLYQGAMGVESAQSKGGSGTT